MEEFKLVDIDWLTAKMYGRDLHKRQNDLPLSKNGIELLDKVDEEINEILDNIDHKIFAPKREKFWDNI